MTLINLLANGAAEMKALLHVAQKSSCEIVSLIIENVSVIT